MSTDFGRDCTIRIVDDDDAFRIGVLRLLRASGLRGIGYSCAGEFLLTDPLGEPGCILLDMSMPGPNGMDLLNALAVRTAAPPVIFITGMVDVGTSVRALQSGAVGYLTKPVQAEALLQGVRDAVDLDLQRRAAQFEISAARQRYNGLTARERTVFNGIVNGKLNKQIAAELGTCERTVKAHRARVMTKLEVDSLADLVRSSMLLDEPVRSSVAAQRQASIALRGSEGRPIYSLSQRGCGCTLAGR